MRTLIDFLLFLIFLIVDTFRQVRGQLRPQPLKKYPHPRISEDTERLKRIFFGKEQRKLLVTYPGQCVRKRRPKMRLPPNGGCDQKCIDLPIGHKCGCKDGYQLVGNSTCIGRETKNVYYCSLIYSYYCSYCSSHLLTQRWFHHSRYQ